MVKTVITVVVTFWALFMILFFKLLLFDDVNIQLYFKYTTKKVKNFTNFIFLTLLSYFLGFNFEV